MSWQLVECSVSIATNSFIYTPKSYLLLYNYMKPNKLKLTYKKQVGFTLQQKKAFEILESYNVNVNEFIRISVREKLNRDWKSIKEEKTRVKLPF